MLTAKQLKFAQHYALHRDPGAAYRHAYNVQPATKPKSVSDAAGKMLSDPAVLAEVDKYIAAATKSGPVTFGVREALDKWLTIATADPNELISLRVGCCRYCHGQAFGYQWREREYLEELAEAERKNAPLPDPAGGLDFNATLPPRDDCPECHGEGQERLVPRDTTRLSAAAKVLYGGVKKTKDGFQILIADRTRALENATRIIGGFTDNVRLSGDIATMSAIVSTTDPKEAARIYADLIARTAVNR